MTGGGRAIARCCAINVAMAMEREEAWGEEWGVVGEYGEVVGDLSRAGTALVNAFRVLWMRYWGSQGTRRQ